MATITYTDVVAGLKKGSTWGTEGDITSAGINLYASSITLSGGYADFQSRDFGQGGKRTNNARLQMDANVAITCDLTYGQGWLALFQGVMGTESSPAEQTASQGDYLVNHDLADSNYGLYWTMGFSIESDRTISIYSMKVISATFNININSPATVTFNCIADHFREGSANTVSEITALTDYAYESVVLGNTNHYFRLDTYANAPLTSADNKQILGVDIAISRPSQPIRGLRGANTPYSLEPKQLGVIDGTLTVRFNELDNATWDILTEWSIPVFNMAELFIDGSVIGTTVNRSLKFQFPYLKVKGAFPAGHSPESNNGLFQPVISFDMLKASSAPSGMSGVTDLLRLAEIHPVRSTKWSA